MKKITKPIKKQDFFEDLAYQITTGLGQKVTQDKIDWVAREIKITFYDKAQCDSRLGDVYLNIKNIITYLESEHCTELENHQHHIDGLKYALETLLDKEPLLVLLK